MAQERLNNAVEKMVDELDRSLLRDLQVSGSFGYCLDIPNKNVLYLKNCLEKWIPL
jgi:hypothetical protein